MILCDQIVDRQYDDIPLEDLVEQNFTVSYDLVAERWASFHDYFPDYAFNLRDNKVIQFYNNRMYLAYVGEAGVFYGVRYPSYITPVFAYGVPAQTTQDIKLKEFQLRSISWSTDVEKNNLRLLEDTWSAISTHNSFQGTRERLLVPLKESCSFIEQYGEANTKRIGSLWYYNYFFNEKASAESRTWLEDLDDFVVINTEDKKCTFEELYRSRLLDNHVIIKLTFNNLEDKRLYFYNLTLEIDVIP